MDIGKNIKELNKSRLWGSIRNRVSSLVISSISLSLWGLPNNLLWDPILDSVDISISHTINNNIRHSIWKLEKLYIKE
jgi:hypothetical protein